MNKKKLTSIVTLVLGIQLVVSISLSSAAVKLYYRNTILPGVSVENIELGGLKYKEAVEKLRHELPWPVPESQFTLAGPEDQYSTIHFKNIDYTADYNATVMNALLLSSKLSNWGNLLELPGFMQNTQNLSLINKFDEKKLKDILQNLAKQYNMPARNAQLAVDGDCVTLFEEVSGKQLDIEATMDQFKKTPYNKYKTDLQFRISKPNLTTSDYGVNSRLSFYMTEFDQKNKNRTYNIQLASKLINNILVKPKEVFSLNKALGPRSQQNGYLPATVIINNKLVPDYGGGVCQVATTLYNSVTLAGLTVVERSSHTLPVPYAPLGKDATIAGDIIDFKFLNNSNYPVLIRSQVQGQKLLVSILGHKEGASAKVIKIQTERSILKASRSYVVDQKLAPGEVIVQKPGRDGYRLKTYEVILENGQEIKRRLVSQNELRPEPEIIATAPKLDNNYSVNK